MLGEFEKAADGVAEDCSTAVADVHGPGRVDARELDLQPLAATQVSGTIARAGRRNLGDQALQPLRTQAEVDVARDSLDCGGAIRHDDRLSQPARDLLRSLL